MLRKRGKYWHYHFSVDGREYRKSTKETSRSMAAEIEARVRTQIRQRGGFVTGRIPLLKEIAVDFLKYVDDHQKLKQNTKKYYRNGWRLLEKQHIAKMRVNGITKEDSEILNFDGSPSNANSALRTLKRMLSFAKSKGHILGDLPRIPLAAESGRTKRITAAMQREALPLCPQPLKDILIFTSDTGLRPWAEIKYLRVENINWMEGTFFNAEGKTSKSCRWVPMSDRVKEILVRRCAARTHGWVFFPDLPGHKRPGDWGLTSQCIEQFRELRKALKWSDEVVLYCAKHDFASEMFRITRNPVVVRDALGHTNLHTSLLYGHAEMEDVREAVNKKNELLN